MSEPFGPSQTRSDLSFEDRREKFQEQFGFEIEPEPTQDNIPPESSWDADGNQSMWGQYFKRHPEARGKPAPKREILKTVQIAPGTYLEDYLPKLLEQAKALLENHGRLQEKLAALEAKVDPNPCAESHGKNYRMIDGECLETQPGYLDSPPAPPVPAGMSKSFFAKSAAVVLCNSPTCKARGTPHEHQISIGLAG
jgi:hypothetical protein